MSQNRPVFEITFLSSQVKLKGRKDRHIKNEKCKSITFKQNDINTIKFHKILFYSLIPFSHLEWHDIFSMWHAVIDEAWLHFAKIYWAAVWLKNTNSSWIRSAQQNCCQLCEALQMITLWPLEHKTRRWRWILLFPIISSHLIDKLSLSVKCRRLQIWAESWAPNPPALITYRTGRKLIYIF